MVPEVLRREPAFRLLFGGQVLSVLGDRMTALILPFAVLAVGGGVGGVAVVSAAQFVPFVVLALPAGVWADRYDRRRILVAADLVRLVTQATAATLLLTGTASVTSLAGLAAVFGAADACFSPALTGFVASTVSPPWLQQANALRGLTFSLGSVAGPVLGGAIVAVGGPGGALAVDAATFLVSAGCILAVRARPPSSEITVATTRHFARDLRQGWHEVRQRPWVVAFLLGGFAYAVFTLPAIFVLGPVLATQRYGGPAGWAVITTGFGLGSILGDLILLRWRPRHALRVAAVSLVLASTQALIIGTGRAVPAVALLEVAAGVFVSLYFSLWETSLQEHIPSDVLSRVASYDYLTSTGALPLSAATAAGASALLGAGTATVILGVVAVLSTLAVLVVPQVRTLPRAEPTS